MSFHKRHISNEQVIQMYRREGMQKVYDWYTNGVDALITESGLASDISIVFNRSEMDETARWNLASEMISSESIKTIHENFNKK